MADDADDGGDNNDVFIYMGGSQRVPRDVTHVRVHKSVKIITKRAFEYCRNLVSIEMHDGVGIIEGWAFNSSGSLRGIKLPGVRVIGQWAFKNCRALVDVEFGDKLDTIGNCAFEHTDLRRIKIPSVRAIEYCAFADCEQLTEVELPKDLETIGGAAFVRCPLRRIAIPLKDNLLENLYVFRECDALAQVDLVGGIHKTISSLLLDSWRNEMNDEIDRINQVLPNTNTDSYHYETTEIQRWMETVIRRIEHYKSEHHTLLKEAMALVELALWKANLHDDAAAREGVRVTRGQRKRARKGGFD